MTEKFIYEGKSAAITSYLTFVGLLIAISMNAQPKNPFARFHINQSAGLALSYILVMIPVSYLNSFTAFLGFFIAFFALWLYALINTYQGKTTPLPLVGDFYQKLFNKL